MNDIPLPLKPEDRRIPCLPNVMFKRRDTNDNEMPLLLMLRRVLGAIRNLFQNRM